MHCRQFTSASPRGGGCGLRLGSGAAHPQVKLWAVELPGLAIPAGSPALLCVVDRFGGAGAKISDNVFTNGAALLGR